MKTSIEHRIGRDALELGLIALLFLAAVTQIAEPGLGRNAALMGLVFLLPALASAAYHFYRDLSEHHHSHLSSLR